MRRWLFFLAILAVVYVLSRMNWNKKERSPFFKRLNETFSILVWVLFFFYAVTFLYWLYTQIFK
jgi:hypothetical protein